jgi:nitrite reductase/ring-hydroxylating ferredoxin subunit
MHFVKVASLAALKKTKRITVSLLGKKVGIFIDEDENVSAIEMTCKHQGADLSKGRFKGSQVTCPRHGWIYDLDSGECINHDSPKLRQHAVEVDGDDIRVFLSPGVVPPSSEPF